MFDYLDPAGTLGQQYLKIPKGGVQSTDAPESSNEMISQRVPGSQGGSSADDFMHQAVPGGGGKSFAQRRAEQGPNTNTVTQSIPTPQENIDPATEKRKKEEIQQQLAAAGVQMKKGGKVKVKSKAYTPKVSSASKRADGCCVKGKTRGRMV